VNVLLHYSNLIAYYNILNTPNLFQTNTLGKIIQLGHDISLKIKKIIIIKQQQQKQNKKVQVFFPKCILTAMLQGSLSIKQDSS